MALRGKGDRQEVLRMLRVLEGLIGHFVSTRLSIMDYVQLAFEMNLSIWIVLGSPCICLIVLVFWIKLIAVFIVAFGVPPKDISVAASVLDTLLVCQRRHFPFRKVL